ncbi:hypothetical protein [Vibrio sp. VB16]|uniref:hypothetical protein n=1 Tax=Vibrio sp. VB16 TaxID=2785746 RepID=UPI0018A09BC1|nr:hypothetical protein [Vibrio sp. VB16]UGA55426.1 hypothetical protein IUZ65_003465 [Vibrio sp. VB16]
MHRFPHIKKNRHGVYYFRLIFTHIVRSISNAPQEISLSLETKDFAIAQERYMILYPCARAFRWSLHEFVMKGNTDVSTMKLKVAHWRKTNQLRELMEKQDEKLFEARRELLRVNNTNKELSEHADRMRSSNQRLKGALKSTKVMMNTTAPISGSSVASRETLIEDAVISNVSPDATRARPEDEVVSTVTTAPKAKTRTRKRVSKNQTLLAYVEKFLAYEHSHSTNGKHSKEARHTNLMRFLDIVGYGVAINALNADHVRHYRDMMHAIPANFEKQGFNKPSALSSRPKWFTKTIEEWDGKTLSGPGIDTHFKHVRMFLTWAHNEHYIKQNFVPMLTVSKKRTLDTKTEVVNFMPHDLQKLFIDGYLYGDIKAPRDNGRDWQFWIPFIALTTGMRSEEIGSLRINSFVEQQGLWCIKVMTSKTKAGTRTFPIPQRLLDAGLLHYRQSILDKHDGDMTVSLFPDLNTKGGEYSNRIGQFFNRNRNGKLTDGSPRIEGYMFKCGVENPSDKETLKFHSFRHGFITLMRDTKLLNSDERLALDLLKNIVGHKGDFTKYGIAADNWNDVTKMTYNHHERISLMSLKERFGLMKQAMDAMDFGVDLSGISYTRFLERK